MKTYLKSQVWYAQWYDREPARVAIEQKAMQTRFPQFSLIKLEDGRFAWNGVITSNNDNRYTILVIYPPDFPNKAPDVYPVDPPLDAGNHQYSDGRLCLYYPQDQSFQTNTTAATVVAVAAAWFFAYEIWVAAGRGRADWPGPGGDHTY
jgi:ubiquitin-protein ligase